MVTWTEADLLNYERNKTKSPKPVVPFPLEKPMNIAPSTDVDKLNKTERAYHQHLVCMNYQWLGVQNITLKLANDCRLTCDFAYLDKDGQLVLIDVKGFQREDALIKIKVAARQFPWIRFAIVKRVKGGGWDYQEVKP